MLCYMILTLILYAPWVSGYWEVGILFLSMKGTGSDSVEYEQGIYCDGVAVYLD